MRLLASHTIHFIVIALLHCFISHSAFAQSMSKVAARNKPRFGNNANDSLKLYHSSQAKPLSGNWKQLQGSQLKYTVEEAPEWTNLLLRKHGWYGGDGIFATPLDGMENTPADSHRKNLIWFSDSMIGDADDSTARVSQMVHNSVAVMEGNEPDSNNIHFQWKQKGNGKPESMFVPQTTSSLPQDYYWLGDGFVNTEKENAIYLFAYKMRNLDANDDWSFTLTKTNLVVLANNSQAQFQEQRQIELPFSLDETGKENGSFGAGIFVNTKAAGSSKPDGFVYIYGVKGKEKNLVVARVKPLQIEDFSAWTFWNGSRWVSNSKEVTSIATGVSNELSVSILQDGSYALVYQQNGMGPSVVMQIGKSPVGPFGDVVHLYNCPEGKENKNYFTYNAKAHPSLSAPGELLISYNVNSFDFWKEIQKSPTLYRPRFFKVKFQ